MFCLLVVKSGNWDETIFGDGLAFAEQMMNDSLETTRTRAWQMPNAIDQTEQLQPTGRPPELSLSFIISQQWTAVSAAPPPLDHRLVHLGTEKDKLEIRVMICDIVYTEVFIGMIIVSFKHKV